MYAQVEAVKRELEEVNRERLDLKERALVLAARAASLRAKLRRAGVLSEAMRSDDEDTRLDAMRRARAMEKKASKPAEVTQPPVAEPDDVRTHPAEKDDQDYAQRLIAHAASLAGKQFEVEVIPPQPVAGIDPDALAAARQFGFPDDAIKIGLQWTHEGVDYSIDTHGLLNIDDPDYDDREDEELVWDRNEEE